MNLLTAADNAYFARLVGMIGSVDKHCIEYHLSVYDIGLTDSDREYLSKIPTVTIKQVLQVNPYITKPYLKHKNWHSKVIGCYTFKPVAIKQEMDELGQVMWLDAGITVMQDLLPIWNHTSTHGYFFAGINDIGWQCTKYTSETLMLSDELISKQALCSAYMGFGRSTYNSIILPAYDTAKDINLYFDDGTARGGKMAGRQDQTIFSIYAQLASCPPLADMRSMLIDGKEYNITDIKNSVNDKTIIYHSRGDAQYTQAKQHLKNKYGI